jgi:hypothetical protein
VPAAGNPQALNRYSYVLNAPTRYTDPTGHYCVDGAAGEEVGVCMNADSTGYQVLTRPLTRKAHYLRLSVTRPLKNWDDLQGSRMQDLAVAVRLLLSEMGGTHLVQNANWREEGLSILWTVRNRLDWMTMDPPRSSFSNCATEDFSACATAPGQYATTTTSRGLDPLYRDPPQAERERSYYGDDGTDIAVDRALSVAIEFFSRTNQTSDPSGGAHYFSHACDNSGTACFSRHVDITAGHRVIESYRVRTTLVPLVRQ